MKFSIAKDQFERLASLVKTVQTITDVSVKNNAYIFKADNTVLYAIISGNGNAVKFSVDIGDFIKDANESNYFTVDVNLFLTALEKTLKTSEKTEVSISGTKLIVSSGKNVITYNLKNTLDESDFTDADGKIAEKLANFGEKTSLEINKEIVDFASVVGKFITMIDQADRVSGMAVEGNKILYSDQAFSIIDRTLSAPATTQAADGTYLKKFIPQSLFNFLSTVQKSLDKFNMNYNTDDSMVYLDLNAIGVEAVLQLPSVICEFPDADSLAGFKPDTNSNYQFEIEKAEFLNKLDMFDGVFSSANWKWKTVNFTMKDDGTVSLSHNDINSDVDTDLVVNKINSSATDALSFKIPGLLLGDYLTKLVDEDKVVLTVSPIDPNTEAEHGAGFVIDVPGTSIVLSKLLDEEVF